MTFGLRHDENSDLRCHSIDQPSLIILSAGRYLKELEPRSRVLPVDFNCATITMCADFPHVLLISWKKHPPTELPCLPILPRLPCCVVSARWTGLRF